jgi:hypothetical protein
MLRESIPALCLVIVVGCALTPAPQGETAHDAFVPYKTFIAYNQANITHLQLGMTRAQVIELMKDYTTKVRSGPLANPYRSSMFIRDNESCEVMYYLTQSYRTFRPITDDQATPVVLKSGVVVGWGRTALADLGIPQP